MMNNKSIRSRAWRMIDPLGEALHSFRMSGVFYTRSEFTAPWALDLPEMKDCVMFHVVTDGNCWLESPGEERRSLRVGELVLVTQGEGHCLMSAPGIPAAKLFSLPREQISERYEVLRHGGGGKSTDMICGAVRFDHPAASQLVALLPRFLRLEVGGEDSGDGMRSMLRLLENETRELSPGGEAIITRLADILVIQTIRAWIKQSPGIQTGWLGALQDPQIGPALLRMHQKPERDWSVESLADEAAMSRSAFSARFTVLVGEPVKHYLTRYRMHTALSLLRESDITVGELAGFFCYRSEAAFHRAFKRIIGQAPGACRRVRRSRESSWEKNEYASDRETSGA